MVMSAISNISANIASSSLVVSWGSSTFFWIWKNEIRKLVFESCVDKSWVVPFRQKWILEVGGHSGVMFYSLNASGGIIDFKDVFIAILFFLYQLLLAISWFASLWRPINFYTVEYLFRSRLGKTDNNPYVTWNLDIIYEQLSIKKASRKEK